MDTNFKSIAEFLTCFKDENACRKYFESIRFKDGDFCPHCGHNKIFRFSDGKRYRCDRCKKDFTIKTGTLFGESKLPLQKWFIAIYLLTTSKKGISSIELSEQCGVSQKTAWFMDHRIREAMKQNDGKLFGTVEVDETYIGGKHNRSHGFGKKIPVMGMTERNGQTRVFQIESRQTHIVFNQIKKNIDPRAFIMTDEASVYKKLPKLGYSRGGVKHSQKQWVKGEIHTNSIESFWALFKRGYHGTYHSMSKKHIQRYINEFAFRFNVRMMEMGEKFTAIVQQISKSGNLSYVGLIEKEMPQNLSEINYENKKGQTIEKTRAGASNLQSGSWCYRALKV
ncbi:MAG: IS1595 family transposase [Candidatus Paceibacterota bacterium]